MMTAFVPFDETKDPKYNTWRDEDKTDITIPAVPGFVTDLVYATRGREIASIYAVWSALFLMSSVIQRDAWFTPPDGDPWLDKEFLNLYVLFIGPAGCGKSSAVNVVTKVLAGVMHELIKTDDGFLKRKEAVIISNMATPEAFLHAMYNHTRGEEDQRKVLIGKDKNGDSLVIKATANAVALVSEFGSLLGKQNYQLGMGTTLLDLYDCPTVYRWNTVKRGLTLIPEVYFNLLGATTADSLASGVNATVLEDGFMSRTIMAHVPDFPRERSFRYQTQCSMSDLAKRLSWIAKTQTGNYQLDKEAQGYYEQWYATFMKKMNKNPEKAGYMIRNRSLALKVAVLLKMSDYKPGKIVHKHHLIEAFDLIKHTYEEVAELINYFANAKVGAAKKALIALIVASQSGMTRRTIANKVSRYNLETVDNALIELWLEGKIVVVNQKGETSYGKKPEGFPQERYTAQIIKHRDKSFNPAPAKSKVSAQNNKSVLEWSTSNNNSKDIKQKPVGDISSPKREWG